MTAQFPQVAPDRVCVIRAWSRSREPERDQELRETLKFAFVLALGANDTSGRPVPLGSRDLLGNGRDQDSNMAESRHRLFRSSSGSLAIHH